MLLLNLNLNIWRIVGFILIIAFGILFFKIIIYIIISLLLFLIGYPLTHRLEKIKIGKKGMPDALAALITICVIIGLLSGLFYLIIPPLVSEGQFLSNLNLFDVLKNILNQFPQVKSLLLKVGTEEDLHKNIASHLNQYVNTDNVANFINHLFDYFGIVVGGSLCVLFITFFMLKDEMIVRQSLLALTPSDKESEMGDIMRTSKKMLTKYFSGLILDMFIVGISAMIILSILGIKNALLISFVAGILNVIPYIGSIITMIIAIFLGVSGCINSGSYELIGPTINKIFFALLSINLIDGFIIQPLIFSKSVKAHPLEIFIVTLMAATIGGIPAMVVALPVYTLLRIVAKEFLTQFKFFKKISQNID